MKVYILSPNGKKIISPEQQNVLKQFADLKFLSKGFEFVKELYIGKEDRIIALDPDYCKWNVENKYIAKIPGLKVICLQSTSYEWIDTNYCKNKGIIVCNNPGFSTNAVAEWYVMLSLLLARKMPLIIKEGWKSDYIKYQGTELSGRTAGIVGLGNIGLRIAEIAQSSGMNVLYWSKNSRNDNFKFTTLPYLFKNSDFIYLTLAINSETKELIRDKLLSSMKSSTNLLSVSGCDFFNHKLVIDMIKSNKLTGYGFETEEKDVMFKYDGNIWAGPELAWATKESIERNAEGWVNNIINAVQGRLTNQAH